MAIKDTNTAIRTTVPKELFDKVKEIMEKDERTLQYCVTKALERFVEERQ